MLFYISDFTCDAYNIYSVSIVYKIHDYLFFNISLRKCNQWGSYNSIERIFKYCTASFYRDNIAILLMSICFWGKEDIYVL